MDVDSAFQAAAEQGRRPPRQGPSLPPSMINRILAARSARKFPYAQYGRKVYLRGTARGVAKYGTSYRSATPMQRQQRSMDGIIGSGSYITRAAGSAGSRIGGYLGNKIGPTGFGDLGKLGRTLGGMAGRFAAGRILGSGSYQVGNALMGAGNVTRPMTSVMDETGDIIVSHREFIQAITPSSANFQTQFFQAINPGLSGFAPWLSQIAQYFEEYELIQCIFEFKSLVTEGNATAAGEVIIATQYNPLNSAFYSQSNMENYDYAISCKMTDSMAHGVECDPSKRAGATAEYIRTGAVPTGQDAKTYDHGVTQVSTVGAAPNVTIGNLYVYYKVRLSKSKVLVLGSQAALPVNSVGFVAQNNSGAITGQTARDLLGSSAIINAGNVTFNALQSPAYDPTGAFLLTRITPVVGAVVQHGLRLTFPSWVNAGVYRFDLTLEAPSASDFSGGDGDVFTNPSNASSISSASWAVSAVQATPTLLIQTGGTAVKTTRVFTLTFVVTINSPQGTVATVTVGQTSTVGSNVALLNTRLSVTQQASNMPTTL